MTSIEISREEYMEPNNGWSQHRSFRTRESAIWYVERMAEPDMTYAIVDRGDYFTVAHRESFAHKN